MLSLWNLAVLDSWVLVFDEFLNKMPYETIEKEINFSINNLSEPTQHVLSKYIAARMIGFVADVITIIFSNEIENNSRTSFRKRKENSIAICLIVRSAYAMTSMSK